MNDVMTRKLRDHGFFRALKECAECGCELWSREIEYGNVKSVACVRHDEAGFEYRFELFKLEEDGAETWGFDGVDSWNALGCMLETWCALTSLAHLAQNSIDFRPDFLQISWVFGSGNPLLAL